MTSSLEQHVQLLLQKSHINFVREKSFSDLKHGYYRFDFYLQTLNILIEVQGAQHYEYSKYFHKKRSDFTKAQERDRQKISWSLAHNVPLYCIPYWEVENLKSAQQLFQQKFLARTKFHNDEVYWAHKKEQKSKAKT